AAGGGHEHQGQGRGRAGTPGGAASDGSVLRRPGARGSGQGTVRVGRPEGRPRVTGLHRGTILRGSMTRTCAAGLLAPGVGRPWWLPCALPPSRAVWAQWRVGSAPRSQWRGPRRFRTGFPNTATSTTRSFRLSTHHPSTWGSVCFFEVSDPAMARPRRALRSVPARPGSPARSAGGSTEPCAQPAGQSLLVLTDPCHVAVGPQQDGGGLHLLELLAAVDEARKSV